MRLPHLPLSIARSSLRPLAASLALAACARAGQVWTVDDNAPADFASIANALASAGSGDVLLVRPGQYAGFTLPNATLSIVADSAGGSVRVLGPVLLPALDSARSIALQGLSLERGALALDAHVSGGVLVLQDCVIASSDSWQSGVNARIDGSGAAYLVACAVIGANGGAANTHGALALRASGIQLVVQDTLLRGGAGSSGANDPHLQGHAAGTALEVDGGSLHASACTFVGGNGGNGAKIDGSFGLSWCGPGGAGGSGLRVQNSASATLLDCATGGGAGGFGPGSCSDGPAGAAEFVFAGALVHSSATPCRVLVAPVLREGASASVAVEGAPGGFALLALGSLPGWMPWSGAIGPFGLGNLATLLPLGTLGGAGALALPSFTVKELGVGASCVQLWAQPVVCAPSGACVLGAPRGVLLLDAGI
jgi:hypothetical protein